MEIYYCIVNSEKNTHFGYTFLLQSLELQPTMGMILSSAFFSNENDCVELEVLIHKIIVKS